MTSHEISSAHIKAMALRNEGLALIRRGEASEGRRKLAQAEALAERASAAYGRLPGSAVTG